MYRRYHEPIDDTEALTSNKKRESASSRRRNEGTERVPAAEATQVDRPARYRVCRERNVTDGLRDRDR